VINQRDLDKKRGRLRLKCAHKTTTKQGGGGVGLRQSTTNNTDCPFRITAWENGDGGWRITTIVADHNHDGTESYVPEDVQLVQRVENVETIILLVQTTGPFPF
jgi:hypothetical protein